MIHPEVKEQVYKEYVRLTTKFPQVSDDIRFNLAKTFVRDLAMADSLVLLKEISNAN